MKKTLIITGALLAAFAISGADASLLRAPATTGTAVGTPQAIITPPAPSIGPGVDGGTAPLAPGSCRTDNDCTRGAYNSPPPHCCNNRCQLGPCIPTACLDMHQEILAASNRILDTIVRDLRSIAPTEFFLNDTWSTRVPPPEFVVARGECRVTVTILRNGNEITNDGTICRVLRKAVSNQTSATGFGMSPNQCACPPQGTGGHTFTLIRQNMT